MERINKHQTATSTYIISRLRCLINRHSSRHIQEIGLQAQVLAEIDRIRAIKTSSRVVPALELGACKGGLGDADTLALATTDAADKVVADPRVDCVPDAKGGHHDVAHHGIGLDAGYPLGHVSAGAGAGREEECLADGELGEVAVDLGVVEDVAAEGGADVVGVDA